MRVFNRQQAVAEGVLHSPSLFFSSSNRVRGELRFCSLFSTFPFFFNPCSSVPLPLPFLFLFQISITSFRAFSVLVSVSVLIFKQSIAQLPQVRKEGACVCHVGCRQLIDLLAKHSLCNKSVLYVDKTFTF